MSQTNQSQKPMLRFSALCLAVSMCVPFSTFAQELNFTTDKSVQTQIQTQYFHQDHVLGTSFDVIVTGLNRADAQKAVDTAQAEIQRLDKILSIWRADSEISQLNKDKHIQASNDLYQVLKACENWRTATCGAFDSRLGQMLERIKNGENTTNIQQQLAQQSIDLQENQTVKLGENVQVVPDAYAKGYIIDKALEKARQAVPNMQGMMIDIGGDIRVWGQAPQAKGWQVGIQNPHLPFDNAEPTAVATLNNQAIVVSGQGYRDVAGQNHLIDTQTGLPANHVAQCVVIGKCTADADALATALAVMPKQQGLDLINNLDGYEAQVTLNNGERYQSNGWNNVVELPKHTQLQQVAGTTWPAGFKATISLNIPKIDVPNYRIPYVVVWVTDANKQLVRTLAVWGKDERWINTNYVWWRRYGRQLPNLNSVAKPSRQPGQYQIVWDGKDDAGKMMPAGQYLIHIETIREHGGHSYQSAPLTVAPTASSKTLPAQTEIGAVKIDFKK